MHREVEQTARWHPMVDPTSLQRTAYEWILDASARAIAERGRFVIVLAGGNTPRGVYAMLRDVGSDGTRNARTLLEAKRTDWSRWDIWFGDERCLLTGDPQRNDAMARSAWLDHVPIPHTRIHGIPAELGADAAARAYADALRGAGNFDLVLLGLGEDGHTASLFPGYELGTTTNSPDTIAVYDAPKPPPERVSLTAMRLSRAREVVFLVEGEPKRDAVARWRAREAIPARAIRPAAGVDVLLVSDLLRP